MSNKKDFMTMPWHFLYAGMTHVIPPIIFSSPSISIHSTFNSLTPPPSDYYWVTTTKGYPN